MSFLEIEHIRKSFGDHVVLDGIDAAVNEGETLVLLGPSGSGKTTLLRVLAGFETPDAGTVRVAGEDVTGLAPARRNFGMVFQHYALFPHLEVAENVAFGLAARGASAAERDSRVAEVLALVELEGFEDRAVHEISGGQQQRVALARALAPNPRVLLLDEPLSNLDPALRERTRRQLRSVLRSLGITAVWVTHEQQEAFDVSDRIALLDGGRLQQLGTADELYFRPSSRFVADFVGQASWLPGRSVTGGEVELAPGVRWRVVADESAGGVEDVAVMLRPEDGRLVEPAAGVLAGRIRDSRFTGHATEVEVELGDGTRIVVAIHEPAPAAGTVVGIEPRARRASPRAFGAAGGNGGSG
jgi:ABC-type Fe3+/spermidine/putrescine transport system ATPase subunit